MDQQQNLIRNVIIDDFSIGEGEPLALLSGPCVIESEEQSLKVAEAILYICERLKINYIFKSSYDKANRSSIHSFRGPGIEEGLRILEKVKKTFGIPIVTDVHSPEEATMAGEVCDLLQIPAFLCRQTDLLAAAAKTGKPISVKKGQFMAPWDMGNVVEKIHECGNDQVILVDRGVSFGYNNLVSDMRAIPIMQGFGVPVCFDATHSVQLPGGAGSQSGGERQFIRILALAAIAAGANCLFMEAHPNPSKAKSDAASQMPLEELPGVLEDVVRIYNALHFED